MLSIAESIETVVIRAPGDVRAAAEALHSLVAHRTGMRTAPCHNIAIKDPMVDADGKVLATTIFGWTEADEDRWWRTPELALASPLPIACRYESEPFWCNGKGMFTRTPNRLLEALDLTDFEARGFTPAAIVAPVHMPFGQIGVVSFTPHDRAKLDLSAEFSEHGDWLGLLARSFVTSYVKTMCRPERVPVDPALTAREVQCLRWAATGKTDDEIAIIMGRSRATVRFHFHNAAVKLGAVNRSQSVFKAGQLGYLTLNR